MSICSATLTDALGLSGSNEFDLSQLVDNDKDLLARYLSEYRELRIRSRTINDCIDAIKIANAPKSVDADALFSKDYAPAPTPDSVSVAVDALKSMLAEAQKSTEYRAGIIRDLCEGKVSRRRVDQSM